MAVSPDPPATCLFITTPLLKGLPLACHHLSSGMKTTTTRFPPRIRRTLHTLQALILCLQQPPEEAEVQRSPEPSTPPHYRHSCCTMLPTTMPIIISNNITQHNSIKAPWSWTCMIGLVCISHCLIFLFFRLCAFLYNFFFFFLQLQQGNVPVSYTVTPVPPHGLAAPLCSSQHIPPSCSSQQQVPACSVVFSTGQHYHPVREKPQSAA